MALTILRRGVIAAAAALFPTISWSTLLIADGALHSITTATEDIAVSGGSRVDVSSGGSIAANSSGVAVALGQVAGELNVSGDGLISGRILNRSSGYGWTINLSGDSRVNGTISSSERDTLNMSGNAIAAQGVNGMGTVNISGNATVLGGIYQAGGSTLQQYVNMSGGSVFGANNAEAGGHGIAPDPETVTLRMSGGLIAGGNGGNYGGSGVVTNSPTPGFDISGGLVRGGNGGTSGGQALAMTLHTDAVITGGTFLGGNGGLYGGDALRISTEGRPVALTIFGGIFEAGFGGLESGSLAWIGSGTRLNLYGGQFGYTNVGSGIEFGGSELNVHGWDLKFLDGLLTGYLSDGHAINAPLSLLYSAGQVNLYNVENTKVPEPSSLLLLSVGLLGLVASRRWRATLDHAAGVSC